MSKGKYIKLAVILAGALLLAYYGHEAVDLKLHPPAAPDVSADASGAQAREATLSQEQSVTRWNNQFARKGFFALVGLFLVLIASLPKKLIWVPKLAFSTGLVALIIHHLLADGRIVSIVDEGIRISAAWIALAFIVKGTGMGCTVWRWKVLLEGQGFRIPLRHLVEAFLIGRFIGSFAPGTSGLDGYRMYDTARYTGKVARSVSVIFVEKLIGFFVLGTLLLVAIPMGLDLFSDKAVNATALVAMALLFLGMMLASLLVLFKPGLIRWLADRFVPKTSPFRKKLDTVVRSVTAYEKRRLHLLSAIAIGFGVHLCTVGMYFCTSRAIFEAPPSGDLFVTSAMMIGATILPLSIAGIGMREGVFAFFLGPVAAIYAFGGYLVGELISLLGGPVWLARRSDFYEVMKAQREIVNRDVEDDEPDEEEAPPAEPSGPLPDLLDYARTGLGAGLVAGLAVAIVDSVRLWLIGDGVDWSIPGYAALLYGPLLAVVGGACGLALGILGRLVQRPAAAAPRRAVFLGLVLSCAFVFVIGYFFLHRDVFGEKAPLFSPRMLGSLAALAAGLAVAGAVLGRFLPRLLSLRGGSPCRLRWALAVYAGATAALLGAWALGAGPSLEAEPGPPSADARDGPNVVLVMNDTHRADHVGAYGCERDLTPNLDALARDGVVFENAFAQASWTRPSVATILTGRYPSSHTATLKGSVLPDEIETLAEVMSRGGYLTLGIATNYNLTPFFNFDQGFASYEYLAPSLPLGASDAQAKLVLVEVLKKIEARFRGGEERPEDYYVVGEVVTRRALEALDRRDRNRPFFLFLSYMDVHDPYFRHPFDGHGISHRANPSPDPSMIPEMKELYAGEVRYWDEQFGDLVSGLKDRGIYDDTLIVVVSDHGEEFGEHGGFWHGTTLYDELLRIVFIAKYPASAGVPGGSRVADWMRLLDVAPLIVDVAGLEIPEEMQGAPAPQSARTPVFSEEDHQGNVLTSIRLGDEGREVKLIEANEGNPRGLAPQELYRTDEDPGETRDLSGDDPDLLETAASALEAAAAAAREGAAEAVAGDLTPEQKRVLQQLGYMKKGE